MKCQWCGTKKSVEMYAPSGVHCSECLKALKRIRELQCGVPLMRKSKEMYQEMLSNNDNEVQE